jgi:hypothetical protein
VSEGLPHHFISKKFCPPDVEISQGYAQKQAANKPYCNMVRLKRRQDSLLPQILNTPSKKIEMHQSK